MSRGSAIKSYAYRDMKLNCIIHYPFVISERARVNRGSPGAHVGDVRVKQRVGFHTSANSATLKRLWLPWTGSKETSPPTSSDTGSRYRKALTTNKTAPSGLDERRGGAAPFYQHDFSPIIFEMIMSYLSPPPPTPTPRFIDITTKACDVFPSLLAFDFSSLPTTMTKTPNLILF